ncbi:STN domain-containing protein [Bradyrhizobium sp. Ai1a-2]|uniref:STN domain-containing protein n=1 Tax=Bradyrhizobium sp. Ai1a-2 TaxID=196490 RepID=UPI0004007CD1|nr:STN domain-containing protein [Bradyrhizobium sp. Ai1a-2]
MIQQERKFKPDRTVGVWLGQAAPLVFALMIGLLPVAAQSGGEDRRSSAAPVAFDIPGQPLSDALYTYSSVTGIEVLVPREILAHRQSSSVLGMLTPGAALRALLAGSGLIPRAMGPNAFTLVPGTPERSVTSRVPRFPQYSTALQAAVTRVLCQLRETRPGGYRIAARLWVSPSGEMTRVGILGSTGDINRDAALSALLMRVVVDVPPPANLPQPTTVVVLPRHEAEDCSVGLQGLAP